MAAGHRATLSLIYLAGVAQGLALVAFPAAGAVFVSPSGFHLSGAQYGAMFAPQVISGELIASYQVGYGLAAFGVGPLIEYAGLSYSAIYSLGGVVALALAGAAWGVGRALPKSGGKDTLPNRLPVNRSPR